MATANTKRNKDADANDLYQTNPKAVHLAVKAGVFRGVRTAYDPCNGLGAISNVLESIGIKTQTSDLIDYGIGDTVTDFLGAEIGNKNNVDAIVFNPPYKLTSEFIDRALEINDKVIMFNRVTFLETEKRAIKLQKDWGLTDIYLHASRVGCKKGLEEERYANAVFYGWYILEPSKYAGVTNAHWII